jgi:hypothetical protein
MKNRKKRLALVIEKRNALYHKTIIHNLELATKNTTLANACDELRYKLRMIERKHNEKKWWQFWKWFKTT